MPVVRAHRTFVVWDEAMGCGGRRGRTSNCACGSALVGQCAGLALLRRLAASIPCVVATGLHAASLAKLPRVSCYARGSSSGNARGLRSHMRRDGVRDANAHPERRCPAHAQVGSAVLEASTRIGSRTGWRRSGVDRVHPGIVALREILDARRPRNAEAFRGQPSNRRTRELQAHVHSVMRFPSLSLNSPLTSMIRSTSIQIPRPPRVTS